MSETLIKIENVSKKFCRDLKRGLWYGVKDVGSELLGKTRNHTILRPKEFWAISDISFELKRGECLGLIGHNGAGKSTLLKMLNGLIKPDTGRIEMHGRVGALIELGAGFNPILTGRENIYVNGAVLGFSKQEVDEKLDEILGFADIGEFIDTPVQYYSSGMKVRLGFAVAAQMEPDVLILDEVLSVGDAGFKVKSFNKIAEIIQKAAVIFVSHSMPQVSRVSNRVLYMKAGKAEYSGSNVNEGIERYFENFQGESSKVEYDRGAELVAVDVYGAGRQTAGKNIALINHGQDLFVDLDIRLKAAIDRFDVMLQITDKDLKIVGQFFSAKANEGFHGDVRRRKISFHFQRLLFIDGEYAITFFLTEKNVNDPAKYSYLGVYRNAVKFRMQGLGDVLYAPIHLEGVVTEVRTFQE
ncbi:MAG TPA: polysaccharide ABC transporter ATP-binding protein [Chryseosolibacter sp.]|nr:polysaccharide ABC transporter ATP-binding protein [Chryseosolibacter sp.]